MLHRTMNWKGNINPRDLYAKASPPVFFRSPPGRGAKYADVLRSSAAKLVSFLDVLCKRVIKSCVLELCV